jgi:hypothetical protein
VTFRENECQVYIQKCNIIGYSGKILFMTKLELLTICDYAAISQDNKLSIIGIFEQIYVSSFPSQHPQMFIVGIIKGEPGKVENLSLTIKNPEGTDAIPSQKININIGPNGKSNIIAGVGNLPLTAAGFYKITLGVEGKTIGEKEFSVFVNNTPGNLPVKDKKYKN